MDQHGDQIDQGVERGSDFVDDKTGGEYTDQIDQGGDRVREGLDGLGGGDAAKDGGDGQA